VTSLETFMGEDVSDEVVATAIDKAGKSLV
jgi:hypothetical protein